MYDVALAREILSQVLTALDRIIRRASNVQKADEFLASEEGREKLDAICMQLITIGESLKNLDRVTRGELFGHYPEVEWKKAMGMRDIIGA